MTLQITHLPDWRHIREVVQHYPKDKAKGADGWQAQELQQLPDTAWVILAEIYGLVEFTGDWPAQVKNLLYLQLPKPGATTAGTRRPIALLPMLYRIWAATRKRDLQVWRDKQRGLGHRPVGEGALDTAFLLAREAESNSAKGRPFGAIFLDCSKCYERVNLAHLHTKLQEAQVPKHLIAPALNMYHAARRCLVSGAVSSEVFATHGIPPGCGLAVDFITSTSKKLSLDVQHTLPG